MFKGLVMAGSTLSRLVDDTHRDADFVHINNGYELVVSLEKFKEYIDNGYNVIVSQLENGGIPDIYDPYVEYINNNNIPVICDGLYEANIMNFHENKKIKTHKTLLMSNLLAETHNSFDRTITVPFFYLQSYVLYKRFKLSPITYNEHLTATKNSFLCLNAVCRPSRMFVYDFFDQRNMLNEINFSFLRRGTQDHEHTNYKKIELPNDVNAKDDGVTWDNMFPRNWYRDSYFKLVTESSAENEASSGPLPLQKYDECFFPTEKTFKAIYNALPFICVADKDYHKNLKKFFGFEMYDEIWDYSFDSEENFRNRTTMLLEQIEQMYKDGIDYNKIKDKIEHNQNIYINENKHKEMLSNVFNSIDN